MYSTVEGVMRKLQQDLYDEVEIEPRIEDTDSDTVAWINSALRRTIDFSELELTTTEDVIRLAADCYCAFRVMSEVLEGQNIETKSLAVFRYEEAMTLVRMYAASHDIIPAFDDIYIPSAVSADATTEVGASFAYAIGSDSVCIG
jgi:hypothetical protein